MQLTPFRNETELENIVFKCHTALWERHGLDPAQAFDEFSKLLFCRFVDETHSGAEPLTVIRPFEEHGDFGKRVRDLFQTAIRKYPGIFETSTVAVDDFAVMEVFRILNNFSITGTTKSNNGIDFKGAVYEKVIGNTFRGQLGQFFTPRNLIDFAVRVIKPKGEGLVYDPSCGSAGFLIAAARFQEESGMRQSALIEYSKSHLIGTEINPRTARVGRLNLLMHGLDYSGIFLTNALRIDEAVRTALDGRISEGEVDHVFANPPFAGFEKDEKILSQFELSRRTNGTPSSVTREILFLELIIRLLRNGGTAGIVIPQGILSNSNLAYVREYIKRKTEILAVVELPDWAFIPSGTSVRGSILFLKRAMEPRTNYHVYMTKVESIGYTSTGRIDNNDDLPKIVREIASPPREKIVDIKKMQERFDAKFYLDLNQKLITQFEHNPAFKLVPLSAVGSFRTARISPKREPARELKVVEISDINTAQNRVIPKTVMGSNCNYSSLREAKPGDILISRRRAYRGAVVEVASETGQIYVIPEISVLRLYPGIDRDYVISILKSTQFTNLMTIYSTGEMSGRISEKNLMDLRIPLPDEHNKIGRQMKDVRQRIQVLSAEIDALKSSLDDMVERVLLGELPAESGPPLSTKRQENNEGRAK